MTRSAHDCSVDNKRSSKTISSARDIPFGTTGKEEGLRLLLKCSAAWFSRIILFLPMEMRRA